MPGRNGRKSLTMQTASAPAWAPSDIAGLALWLKADTGITLDGNGNVSAWADQSGNGRNAAQASTNLRPLWVASSINSLPAVVGDGVDDIMTFTAPWGTANYSIYVVTAFNTGGSWVQYSGFIGTESGSRSQEPFMSDTGSNPAVVVRTQTLGDNTYIAASNPSNIKSGIAAVHSFKRTGSLNYNAKWTHGSRVSYALGSNMTIDTNRLFSNYFATSAFKIAEVIGYASDLSAGDETLLSTYLTSKYGVAI